MNYLHEILAFRDFRLTNNLSTGQIALWFALMDINNMCAWEEWFTASNRTLESLTGMTRDGIAKARNVLKQKGLIEFKANGANKATLYKINSLCVSNRIHTRIHSSIQPVYTPVHNEYASGIPLNKYNINKNKINNYNNARVKKSPLNNYDDGNERDYSGFDEKVLDMMLSDT